MPDEKILNIHEFMNSARLEKATKKWREELSDKMTALKIN